MNHSLFASPLGSTAGAQRYLSDSLGAAISFCMANMGLPSDEATALTIRGSFGIAPMPPGSGFTPLYPKITCCIGLVRSGAVGHPPLLFFSPTTATLSAPTQLPTTPPSTSSNPLLTFIRRAQRAEVCDAIPAPSTNVQEYRNFGKDKDGKQFVPPALTFFRQDSTLAANITCILDQLYRLFEGTEDLGLIAADNGSDAGYHNKAAICLCVSALGLQPATTIITKACLLANNIEDRSHPMHTAYAPLLNILHNVEDCKILSQLSC